MKNLILLLFITLTLNSFGQKLQDISFEDLNTKQANFIGGTDELKKFFAINLRYPQDIKYGTMIGIVIINQKNNELKTITFNSPGKSYDKEFDRVVQLSKNRWEKNDKLNILYSTITLDFSFEQSNYFTDYDHQPNFIAGNIYLRNYANKKLKSDDKLVKELNENYSKKEYKKVIKLTNELIARNPFYPNFYSIRIKALKALSQDISKDQWILKEFLNQK